MLEPGTRERLLARTVLYKHLFVFPVAYKEWYHLFLPL